MSQALDNYTSAVRSADAVIQQIQGDQWNAPTPCEEWSVRDVVTHLCSPMAAIQAMATTGQVAAPEPIETNDPIGTWNATRDGVLEAISVPGATSQVGEFWFGESSIDDILAFAAWDQLGHAWDIAVATGRDVDVDPAVVEATIGVISANADMLRSGGLMGDEITVDPDAPAIDRFIGLIGRNPNR